MFVRGTLAMLAVPAVFFLLDKEERVGLSARSKPP